jgi:hypothetical protein
MRSWILVALLAFMAIAQVFSATGQARAAMPCIAFDRVCACPWHDVDCVPVCRILPWTGACAPTY